MDHVFRSSTYYVENWHCIPSYDRNTISGSIQCSRVYGFSARGIESPRALIFRAQRGVRVEHRNYFLAALSPEDLAALSPGLKEIVLATQQGVSEPGEHVDAVLFPTGSCLSIVTTMRDRRAVETSTIGRAR